MSAPATSRATAPAPRSERIDKRDALLRGAVETFAARGFFNAQVADIARAAGVAAGTVYLYYRSKDDLLISIFEKTMRETIAEGHASIAGIADPVQRLRTIARLHLDRLGRDRPLAIVFQVELRQSTKFMERFSSTHLREYLGIIRDIVAQGQAERIFRQDVNPTLAAKLLFGMLDEMATNWILSKRKYSLADQAESIVDLFVRGAGATPHAPSAGHRDPALRLRSGRPDPSTRSGSSRAESRDERQSRGASEHGGGPGGLRPPDPG